MGLAETYPNRSLPNTVSTSMSHTLHSFGVDPVPRAFCLNIHQHPLTTFQNLYRTVGPSESVQVTSDDHSCTVLEPLDSIFVSKYALVALPLPICACCARTGSGCFGIQNRRGCSRIRHRGDRVKSAPRRLCSSPPSRRRCSSRRLPEEDNEYRFKHEEQIFGNDVGVAGEGSRKRVRHPTVACPDLNFTSLCSAPMKALWFLFSNAICRPP